LGIDQDNADGYTRIKYSDGIYPEFRTKQIGHALRYSRHQISPKCGAGHRNYENKYLELKQENERWNYESILCEMWYP
jgi:hypothetical protein